MNHESRMFQCFLRHLVLFQTIPDFSVYCEFNLCFSYHSVSLILTQLVFTWFCLLSSQSNETSACAPSHGSKKGEKDYCRVWGRDEVQTRLHRHRHQEDQEAAAESESRREGTSENEQSLIWNKTLTYLTKMWGDISPNWIPLICCTCFSTGSRFKMPQMSRLSFLQTQSAYNFTGFS